MFQEIQVTKPVPTQPKIYHIGHVDNLASVIRDGCLWSDSTMSQRQGGTVIGMSNIKERRLKLPVSCHPGTCVGDYVPFYFCPRSIMLYLIHKKNHADLEYRGGQEEIVHLEADLTSVVQWADEGQHLWAFSLSNAAASYAQFRSEWHQLVEVDWRAVESTDFRNSDVKEAKQAEFLIHKSFPWKLIKRIGARSPAVAQRVHAAMRDAVHRPQVGTAKQWYY